MIKERKRTINKTGVLLLCVLLLLGAVLPALAEVETWYENIYVTTDPDKMTYTVGDSFDPTGIVISGKVRHSDGTSEVYTLGLKNLTWEPAKFTKAGVTEVTLTVPCLGPSGGKEDFTTSITVQVKAKSSGSGSSILESGELLDDGWYESIWVEKNPTKLTYNVGDKFDPEGMVISGLVCKNTGEKYTMIVGGTTGYSPKTFEKTGKQKVTITKMLPGQNGIDEPFYTSVTVTVNEAKVAKITKSPTGEEVEEGGSCSFIARADNCNGITWYFTNGSKTIEAGKAANYFDGLRVKGTDGEKLTLSRVPMSLDGWKVYAVFHSDYTEDTLTTKKAAISVYYAAVTSAPTQRPTATPAPTRIPTLTPVPTLAPVITPTPYRPSPTPTPHVHSFSNTMKSDDQGHYYACVCGEQADYAPHTVEKWYRLNEKDSQGRTLSYGTCIVCGKIVRRSEESSGGGFLAVLILLGILLVGGLIALYYVMMKREQEELEYLTRKKKGAKPSDKNGKKKKKEWFEDL